jgi:hypothetical protein
MRNDNLVHRSTNVNGDTMNQHETARALAEFLKWALEDGAWQGLDLDGGDIEIKAGDLGLLIVVPYDPAVHGDGGFEFDIEPGDDWYELKDEVKALLK